MPGPINRYQNHLFIITNKEDCKIKSGDMEVKLFVIN